MNTSWNTPPEILYPLRDMCGRIYLDPCSNETSVVDAEHTVEPPRNGLETLWMLNVPNGRACFVNPPYSREDNEPWARKWASEANAARGGLSHLFGLVQSAPGSAWFKRYLAACDAVCFPDKRIAFLRGGEPIKGANFGNALFYAGLDPEQFARRASHIGEVMFR